MRLDLSLDDFDVDFGIVNDVSFWEVGLEEDEFDFEFYGI